MTRWVNSQLKRRNMKVSKSKLVQSLSAGDTLCHFAELISGRIMPMWEKNPKTREQKLKNVNTVIALLHENLSSVRLSLSLLALALSFCKDMVMSCFSMAISLAALLWPVVTLWRW